MGRDKQLTILELAKNGAFGTPENPNRLSSGRANFWNGFFNVKAAYTPCKQCTGYDYYIAGKMYAKFVLESV